MPRALCGDSGGPVQDAPPAPPIPPEQTATLRRANAKQKVPAYEWVPPRRPVGNPPQLHPIPKVPRTTQTTCSVAMQHPQDDPQAERK